MPKRTACVWCWAIIKVPDDYDDMIHKGVCSKSCATNETAFNRFFNSDHYWKQAEERFGVTKQEKEKNVPCNPRHSPPKAP